jgi:hypothetical protein
MVLSDPPIILQLEIAGVQGSLTWVDAANYGVEFSESANHGQSNARRVASWFVAAASTLHTLGPCGWRMTAGSQAMHIYRSLYLDTPILSHTSRHATALERASLFGGRNEVYRLGRIPGPVYCYDFRSMYPYICTVLDLPVRLVDDQLVPTLQSLGAPERETYAIAEVAIETDQAWYPWRAADEIRYPVGRFITTLGGPELARAVQAGHVRSVRRAALYAAAPVLSSFSAALFAARRAAHCGAVPGVEVWIKRLLVSLPGKFAQRDRLWITRQGATPLHEWGEWFAPLPNMGVCRWRSIGGIVQVMMEGEYVSGCVPAITSAVCAAGRDRLLSAILAAGWENVYYTDTDSIVCNEVGRRSLEVGGWVRPDELGFLRLEEVAESAVIYGLKHYRIGRKARFAGSPGGGDAYWSEAGPQPVVPWIGSSFRAHERPEARRVMPRPPQDEIGDTSSSADGGWIRPLEVREW